MSRKTKPRKSLATRSVRAGIESDAQHGSVVPPIYLSTNFAFEGYRRPRRYDYTRSGNPTRDQLAAALADLEGGAGAVVTCTGLSAITLILATLAHGRADSRTLRLLRRDLPDAVGPARAGKIDGGLRGSERCGGAARGARGKAETGVDRDAEQSSAAHRRYQRPCRGRPRGGRAGRRRTTRFCRRSGSSLSRSVPTW